MVPDLDLQLQVALKALRETVAPAVDPGNRVALEQLHLSIATLTMVRERLPLARRFARRRLEDALDLAHAVAAAARKDAALDLAALDATIAASPALLLDPVAETADFDAAIAAVTAATLTVIRAAQGGNAIAAIDAAVLTASAPTIERGRAWFLAAGFEPDPTAIRPLATLL